MSKYRNKKHIFPIFLMLAVLGITQNTSFAAYDVVKAKTAKNYNAINSTTSDMDFYSYSEYEQDDFDSEGDNSEKLIFEDKIKKFFAKKEKKQKINDDAIEAENVQEEVETPSEQEAQEQNQQNDEVKPEENTEEEKISEENKEEEQENQENSSEVVEQFVSEDIKLYKYVEVDEKFKYKINADKMVYDDVDGNVYAYGNVELIAKEQKVVIKADEMVLDKANQLLKLNGNVKVIKEASEMVGESIVIDFTEENILMDNPTLYAYSFAISAQEGHLIANDIQMLNGSITSVRKKDFPLMSRGFMGFDAVTRNAYFGKSQYVLPDNPDEQKRQSYRIDAKEVVITCLKDHNSVLLKDSDIYYNNHKIVRGADFEIIRDKQQTVSETNAPEAGNLRNFGMYAGYGAVFKLPKGQIFKLMPVVAFHESDYGIGLIGRYRTPRVRIDGGWNTASENLVVRGKYDVGNGVKLTFGRNAYLPEGFMGARRSGYAAQLQYLKSYNIRDLNARFSNGIYAGVFSDYQKKHQEDAFSTTRFRYMAQLNKNLYQYKNEEQDFAVVLRALAQGAATVYGTGETHGIVRIGPTITTRFKRWDSTVGYMLSGLHGETPFKFDRYRYGKSTITINERFNVNEKLSFGFRFFVTPMKDNPQEKLLTEAKIYVVAGPTDMKLALSYDFVRDIAHLNFMFLIGSENTKINFDKLTTKDIEGKANRIDFYQNIKPVRIQTPEDI